MFYIISEIGGTGGGMFRPMYGRFLEEAAAATGKDLLDQAAGPIYESGARITQAALLFEHILEMGELGDKIEQTAELLLESAALEEEAFGMLSTTI